MLQTWLSKTTIRPDEVFRHIEVQRGSSAVTACSADCELRIGGRLLIVVTFEPMSTFTPHLANVIAEGKRARDKRKYNRFRLVVTGNPDRESDQLFQAFESLSHKDERTHLHVLGKTQVPNLFG